MLLRIWESLPTVLGMIVMTGGVMLALWWAWESYKALIGVEYEEDEP